jgi:hypothetical protein
LSEAGLETVDITFVVIAYNEEGSLRATVEDCLAWMKRSGKTAPILIMDDASTDRTPEIADELAAEHDVVRVHHQPANKGQFNNIRSSWSLVETTYFTIIPGDNQFDIASFDMFLRELGRYDIIFGFPNNEEVRGRVRVVLSHAWRLYMLILFGFPVTYLGGLVIIPTDLVRRMRTATDGYLGWYETALRLCVSGATYIQIPFTMRQRVAGESRAVKPIQNFRDLVGMLGVWRRIKGTGFLPAGPEHDEVRAAYESYRRDRGPDDKRRPEPVRPN